MQRHEREVFGIDAFDLADMADVIYASAYQDRINQDTNDSVRTGVFTPTWAGYYNYQSAYADRPIKMD